MLGGPTFLNMYDKGALGRIIPFIDHYPVRNYADKTWRVFHSAKVIEKVVPAFVLTEFTQYLYYIHWDTAKEAYMNIWLDKMKNMTEWKDWYHIIDETRMNMLLFNYISP